MNVELKSVTSCPTNASSWLSNGIKLQCPNDTLGRNLYQCVPNDDRSSLVEFCLQGSIGRYGANLCPYAVSTGHLDALNCSTFLNGCPEESYNTNEVYKYPACLEINTEKRCYLAIENCPNDSVSISQNTSYVFQPEDDTTAIIAGVVSTFIIALIVLVVLYLLFRRHLRNRRNRRNRCSEEEELKALLRIRKIVPDRRIDDAICCLQKTITHFPDVTARELARVVWKIISMTPVMDIFKVGRWTGINCGLQDHRLAELASELPRYCVTSKAENTAKQYRYAFNTFCKWCSSFNPGIQSLPASENNVALYIIHLAKQCKSSGTIHSAIHAISWAHSLAGYIDPCDSALVKTVKEGAVRETSKPVIKKEPITPEHLKTLVSTFGEDGNLYNLRTLCMCLLGFAGFLRFSEIVNIRYSDICVQTNCVEINIVKSKTDVYKTGHKVCIARTFCDTCPVNMLEKFLKLSNADMHSPLFLFRSLSFCKKSQTYKLRSDNRPISYTRAREIILDSLEKIGLDKCKFGVHSLRSGGATSAAAAGVSDRLFKKHGRWRSENSKDGYVKENQIEKLSVTKNLGI